MGILGVYHQAHLDMFVPSLDINKKIKIIYGKFRVALFVTGSYAASLHVPHTTAILPDVNIILVSYTYSPL